MLQTREDISVREKLAAERQVEIAERDRRNTVTIPVHVARYLLSVVPEDDSSPSLKARVAELEDELEELQDKLDDIAELAS